MSETPDTRQQIRPGVHHHPPGSSHECSSVQEFAAPFALAAVEPEERDRIERHNRQCPSCADFIAEVRQTVSYLAFAVPQVAPPAHAKAELFARIARSGRAEFSFPDAMTATAPARPLTIPSSREAFAPVPSGWDDEKPGRPATTPKKVGRSGWFRPNWQLIATPLATVPLVLALGIVSLWGISTKNRLSARSAEVSQLNAQIDFLNGRVTDLNQTLAEVDDFIVADDAKRYDMTAAGSSSSRAVGQVIANPNTDEAMLVVKGLSDAHSMYEVLLESSAGDMVPAGTLPVNQAGDGKTVLKLTEPFASYRSVHVKPKFEETGFGISDSVSRVAPDALYGTIDPNLGGSADTNAPNVGQSS